MRVLSIYQPCITREMFVLTEAIFQLVQRGDCPPGEPRIRLRRSLVASPSFLINTLGPMLILRLSLTALSLSMATLMGKVRLASNATQRHSLRTVGRWQLGCR
jgi:hypothetical protein